MITLYTPATGFPDLEAKIAYGLARIGIEAYGSDKVVIENCNGFYAITIDGEIDSINQTFNMVSKRVLSSVYIPFNTPGIAGRSANNMSVNNEENFTLDFYTSLFPYSINKNIEPVCRHKTTKIGNVIGFTAATSYHHRRNGIDISIQQQIPRRPTNPKKICKTCGLLSLLGIWFASFIFSITDKEVMITPIPRSKVTGQDLEQVFSLQHKVRKDWINQEIPQTLIPLIFLSKIPSSSDILSKFDLFIAVLSRQQGYHVDGLFLIPIGDYLAFIKASPYNPASVEIMLRGNAFNALQELNQVVFTKAQTSLLKFARLYVQETSSNNFTNLLYPQTAKYLLEVTMIKSEIIENPALLSLSRTLRYFIRERKYGYADDIRNARKDSKDFEETIVKMLREAELRRVQQEQDKNSGKEVKNWVHLPNEEEIKEIFRLANEDFDQVKTALVMLAFSFPTKKEEKNE